MRNSSGVSLIELLLVVAIMIIILASAYPLGAGFLSRNKFDDCVTELTNSFRVAQLNSLSGKEASNWGVSVLSGQIILFKGATYAGRDPVYDEVFNISPDISLNPSSYEVIFDRLTGEPDQTVSIDLSDASGNSVTISLNEVGTVDVN